MELQKKMGQDTNRADAVEEINYDVGCCGQILVVISTIFIILLFPISIWFCIKIVQEYERAVIFRLGMLKSSKAAGPGMFWVNMFTDSFIKVIICYQLLEQSLYKY